MKCKTVSFLLFIIGLFLFGCSQEEENSQMQSDDIAMGNHSAHAEMNMTSGEASDESIYNVTSTWKNRHGEQVQLSNLQGDVQVVAMVYTHCEFACPRILADMQRIKDGLSEEATLNTNFTIISIDPERDTPERLSNFAEENNLSDEQWTLLNGRQGDILEVAALLGVRYKRISETDFTHSNMITVLNQEGEIAHQRKQLSDDQSEIIRTIEKLTSI